MRARTFEGRTPARPGSRICRGPAVRGSTQRRGRDKGGLRALEELRQLLEQRVAVLLAVDGPQGPRNAIHRGVAVLPRQVEGAVVLPLVVVPSRRWILSRTWDRMQIPKPFATIQVAFGPPIDAERGEPSALIRERIAKTLEDLEMRYDPDEAQLGAEAAMARSRANPHA